MEQRLHSHTEEGHSSWSEDCTKPAFRTAQRKGRSHRYRKLCVFGAQAHLAFFPVLVPMGAAKAAAPPLHGDHCTAPMSGGGLQAVFEWFPCHQIDPSWKERKQKGRCIKEAM